MVLKTAKALRRKETAEKTLTCFVKLSVLVASWLIIVRSSFMLGVAKSFYYQ
jgi:hypothetical protein